MKKALKHTLTGLTIPQEYVCLSLEDFSDAFLVFLTTEKPDFFMDVSANHIFLGYKPLLIAIIVEKSPEEFAISTRLCLNFCIAQFTINQQWKGFQADSRSTARLIIKKIGQRNLDQLQIHFFEGEYGEHTFLHPFHKLVNQLQETLRRRNQGNVNLPGNLYDQVRIVYSIPRTISLITVGDRTRMNMFPTDLHGKVGKDFYAGSLRVGGKANLQVESSGKIVMSKMPSRMFKDVYALGKNHMKDLEALEHFPVLKDLSKVFSIPVPAQALRYLELERIDFFDAGIHRIHLYRKIHEQEINDEPSLAHIHQYYAQWRLAHGFPTRMLLR